MSDQTKCTIFEFKADDGRVATLEKSINEWLSKKPSVTITHTDLLNANGYVAYSLLFVFYKETA